MKRIATLFLSIAGLLSTAGLSQAQIVPPPDITSIPSQAAFAPGNVVLFGTNLGLATEVRIDGQVVPIVRVRPNRLVVGPVAPRAPGQALVELKGILGQDSASMDFTPSLRGQAGTSRLKLELRNGDVGSYVLRYSYSPLAAPVSDPGIYYQRYLPLSGGNSGVLRTGTVGAAGDVISIIARYPPALGLLGRPIVLQAQCVVGVGNSAVSSFTNPVTLPGLQPL